MKVYGELDEYGAFQVSRTPDMTNARKKRIAQERRLQRIEGAIRHLAKVLREEDIISRKLRE